MFNIGISVPANAFVDDCSNFCTSDFRGGVGGDNRFHLNTSNLARYQKFRLLDSRHYAWKCCE